ncbi:hypothetical protein AAHE18_08G252300 [Arachis hypogaea]
MLHQLIFMDEIDSIGSARMESGSGNGDSEVQRTMLELLNQLDGFEASNKIKVLMAQTGLISWIKPSLDLDELTGRLNFQTQMRSLGRYFENSFKKNELNAWH